MKLLGAVTSPYVRKVRIVMAEKKLEYQFELEDVWAPDSTIVEFNPLGKVPCLLMETGEALYDSRVIVEYLDTLSPVGKLIPTGGRERTEVKVWEALADGLLDAAIAARMEAHWAGRTEAQRSQVWIDRQLGKVHDCLAAMSRALGEKHHVLRHSFIAGRYRCRLRAGLFGFPLPAHRLAQRLPQSAAFAGQADATQQLHRNGSCLACSVLSGFRRSNRLSC